MNPAQPCVVRPEPVPEPISRLGRPAPGVVRLGRVRVPLSLTVRPWATLYRLPDGRTLWCVRLRDAGEIRTRCIGTDRLLAYARSSGLARLEREMLDLLGVAGAPDAPD